MIVDDIGDVHFVTLGVLRLVLPIQHLGVVVLYLFDVAEIEVHALEALVGHHLDLLRLASPCNGQQVLVANNSIAILLHFGKATGHHMEGKHLTEEITIGVGAVPQLAVQF